MEKKYIPGIKGQKYRLGGTSTYKFQKAKITKQRYLLKGIIGF
jgi:hypothetical protein